MKIYYVHCSLVPISTETTLQNIDYRLIYSNESKYFAR